MFVVSEFLSVQTVSGRSVYQICVVFYFSHVCSKHTEVQNWHSGAVQIIQVFLPCPPPWFCAILWSDEKASRGLLKQ